MAPVSIGFGVVLIVLGVVSFFVTAGEHYHPTSLIPAVFGVVLLLLGVIALKERMRKHAMHLAAMVGLIGFLIPAVMGLPKLPALLNGTAPRPAATVEQLIMAALCLLFVLLCVRSFIVARRNRARQAAP